MAAGPIQERNQGESWLLILSRSPRVPYRFYDRLLADATVYVGGLDEKVSEAILWELFLQAGPVGR